MKTCKMCGQAKEPSAYSSYRRGEKTYLSSYCRPCSVERNRTYYRDRVRASRLKRYKDNPEPARQAAYRWKRENRDHVNAYVKAKYRTPKGRAQELVGGARSRARKRGLPFDLTVEWVVEKLVAGMCEYSGLPLTLEPKDGRRHPRSPSIDRIDPSGGCTKANCRIACLQANIALLNFGQASMDELVEARARTISSQASKEEGSTTRARARRVKRPEAPDTLNKRVMI